VKHGAIHRPFHPTIGSALAFQPVRSVAVPNWFTKWNWPATGNILGNDQLGDCVEAADVVLIQGFANSLGFPPIVGADATELAETRYEQVSGWNGVVPGNDPGTITQVDAFAWQSVPIVAGGRSWAVDWHIVPVDAVANALIQSPLLLTLGLCEDDEDDPDLWHNRPSSQSYVAQHRVVCGAADSNWWACRSYGNDYPISPDRVVGADMMVLRHQSP
jgi:hypothetical protein